MYNNNMSSSPEIEIKKIKLEKTFYKVKEEYGHV